MEALDAKANNPHKRGMTTLLSGPRLAPRSGHAKQLIVFLHGYGADGNDLIDIGQIWQEVLPDAAFVSPHAPEPCAMSPMGRQWFALTKRDEAERWSGVTHAAPALHAFLDSELAAHDLDDSKLALVGFSQGTMMALHVGLRRPHPPAAIIGYSGLLVGEAYLHEINTNHAPAILLTHGDQDPVIPCEALDHAQKNLTQIGISVEHHLVRGLGHGINNDCLLWGARFLEKHVSA
jgi:phospholipase/carboxylesterase